MTIYKKYINFVIVIFIISISLGSNSIRGTVYDSKSNESLIGASVYIEETSQGTATNIDGQFLLENVNDCENNCTLKVSYMGYETFSKNITLKNEDLTLDINLISSTLEMDETIITSQKRQDKVTDAPAAIELVSSEDIKREESTNLGGYLKGIKGVDFTSSGINNYSISVRGFNSSFTTRLLTLTDGRIASIPALRVINYSLIPQSSKDIESIEIVLGPSTALYGANAHSGVVSINSKSPADSEGFDISMSSSINDNRDLFKFDTRWAKKINRDLSFKISGSYLQGNEWEFVSEEEYKLHSYPYSGFKERAIDRKDNNPWNNEYDLLTTGLNSAGEEVRIGNGEPFAIDDENYDPDGDGISGEDWFNGIDDDRDGLIDEDYFFSDGFDNDNDCEGDTNLDGCYCCGWNDLNKNQRWDAGEPADGDINVDENIDVKEDQWFDGVDNDGNGYIDETQERYSGSEPIPNWQNNLENRNIIVFNGRENYLINGERNPWYLEGATTSQKHIYGNHYYDENKVEIIFDNYIWDYGNDGIPGDSYWNDQVGDNLFNGLYEGGNTILYQGSYIAVPTEGCLENPFTGNGECDNFGQGFGVDNFIPSIHDCGLDGLCPDDNGYPGQDYGEGNGVWDSFDWNNDGNYTGGDMWNSGSGEWQDDNGNGIPDEDDASFEFYDTYPYADGIWNEAGADGIIGTEDDEILQDYGQDGLPNTNDPGENDGMLVFIDNNELDGIFDIGDGCYGCEAEPLIVDFNNNGYFDCPDPNDLNECDQYEDVNNDGKYTPSDYKDNFQRTTDVNGDGIDEYPDFKVVNGKVEFRLDYDPSRNFNLSFQTGYSASKTQQVTGFGRYLTDVYEYTFYQLRARYKNWFSQIYLNQGNSGNTRGYLLGNVITDKSKNMAFQLQNNFKIKNTKFVWGLDYFTTIANTNGSILNDGPNGYDNDGDWWYAYANNIDDDFDSDDYQDINGNGRPDPGDYNPLSAGLDGIFGNEDDDYQFSTGVNPYGYIFADGIDNDRDGFDSDGDTYPDYIEQRFGTNPNNPNDIPTSINPQTGEEFNVPFDPNWALEAIDELIDENWCGNEQYKAFVTDDNFSSSDRDGKRWECKEGVDEPDEFLDVTSEEFGVYFQTKTNPFGNKKWEIITAARIDKHDKLDEDLQFAPKFGVFYSPNDFQTYRITYGKAFNTPSAITLYTDLFVDRFGQIEYYLRGNKDGTPYQRVGENYDVVPPQMEIDGEMHFIGDDPNYWAGTGNYNHSYEDRVQGAPYFFAFNTDQINTPDFIPIDTARYTIWVPELNDTGRIYTPLEALNIADVEPIKTEKIQTIEIGFKGFLSEKIHATIDYYTSFYEDFFSAPTVITPLVIERKWSNGVGSTDVTNMDNISVVGLLPVNDFLSNPPYGTQWNGSDDDNDWSSNISMPFFNNNLTTINSGVYESGFEIDFDTPIYNIDTNDDGQMDAFDWSLSQGFDWASDESTLGEFGYVDYIRCPGDGQNYWNSGYSDIDGLSEYCANNNFGGGDTIGVTLYHPEDVINLVQGNVQFGSATQPAQFWEAVGVDEYSTISGLSEAETITSPVLGADGRPVQTPGFAYSPYHSILAPLNYGKVNMQGIDIGLSYLMPEYNLILSGNFSFYSSTEYYNKLTKKNDPINAPKFKMNASISWSSEKFGNISVKYRHVDRFLWKDGIWSGYIGPYDLIDVLYSYKINDYLELNLTAQNIFNDVHKELIGGAFMGRQFIVRLGASL